MRYPKEKIANKLSPSFIREAIVHKLLTYQGKVFEQKGDCPQCEGSDIVKNTLNKNKIFAIVITECGFRNIRVSVRWFTCKTCRKVFPAIDAPFYPNTNYGNIIIDLILYHANLPAHAVEKKLLDIGIQVDRDTILNYFKLFGKKIKKKGGGCRYENDNETFDVDLLKILFSENEIETMKKNSEAVSDETYPTRKGEKKKWRSKQKELKKCAPKYPRGFTVALSYLVKYKVFASVLISYAAFNKAMAYELLKNLEGIIALITDGHKAYEGLIKNHVRCVIHKFRNRWKKYDSRKKYPKDFFKMEYEKFYSEFISELKTNFPFLFEGDDLKIEGISTNSIEGGNWRVKYILQTLYSKIESIFGRTSVIAIKESMKTFNKGKPMESYAHRVSDFEFGDIMSIPV